MKKLLLVFLLLIMPMAACAEITMETVSEANGKMATNRYTFSQEIPDVVQQKLAACGYQDVACVSGLCIERLVLEYPKGQDDLYRSSDALLVAEKEGGYSLVGMQWTTPEHPVCVQEYGSLGLALEKGFQLQFAPSELRTVDYLLTAECGGTVRSWRINLTGENVWYIAACETPGGETVRWDEFQGAFRQGDELHYACWWPQLESITSFDAFPVTQQQAVLLAQNSWNGLPMEKLAVLGGNLREKPTGKSRSLGLSQGAVLGEVLGEQPGLNEPWYQVRVGNTVGWVSGGYVDFVVGGNHYNGLLRPLKRAIVKSEIPLRYAKDDHTPVMTLQAGAELQVLFADADGWLHVVMPTARATRCMDINGIYGYVRLDEVSADGVILP